MMGALFYRSISPGEIVSMAWSELKYWYAWHDRLIAEKIAEEQRAIRNVGKK